MAHELTDEIKSLRIELEKKPEIRYRNPLNWIRVNPDISRIFIDRADRKRLETKQLYPVKVRRNIIDLFKSQLLTVGIFFLISLVSIAGLVPLEKSWLNFFITIIAGIVISVVLMVILLRSQIK